MIACDLRIRPTRVAVHEPRAWYMHGGDLRRLLHALRETPLRADGFSLHLLPQSHADLTLRGVLIRHDDGALPDAPPGFEPYGVIADCLYLPTHARLTVALTDDELREALPHCWTIYQPAVGFVGYSPQEVLRPHHLIDLPQVRDGGWHAAVASLPLNDRILSMRPDVAPSADDVIDAGRDDIGVDADGNPPAAPDEPSSSLPAKFGRALTGGIGRAIYRIAGGASAPGLTRGIAQWAARLANQAEQANEWLRHKEINRLLDMLRRNPLDGLRHAIPLGGEAPRGIAPPSNRLGTRDARFSLGGLSSSGPTDYWDIQWEQQQALTNRYRELAIEETQRGNYRRAAYIYANLLSDLHAAAAVLAQGGFFRDAAVIYRDRLNQPQRAAQCLEEGGLLVDAADLYEQQNLWLKAASIHERLDDHANARRCYEQEIEACLARSDRLAAARLQEEKLRDIDAAITTLRDAWPAHAQSRKCLAELFALLNRTCRHAQARGVAEQLLAESASGSAAVSLASVLSETSHACADRALGAWMADEVLILASTLLSQGCGDAEQTVAAAVADLFPQDRLIRRDGRRFLVARHAQRPAPKRTLQAPQRPLRPVRVRAQWQLHADVKWHRLAIAGDSFIAAGVGPRGHEFVRGIPGDERFAYRRVMFSTLRDHLRVDFAAGHSAQDRLAMLTGLDRVPDIQFPGSDYLAPLTLHCPAWLHFDEHLAVAHGASRTHVAFRVSSAMWDACVEVYLGDVPRASHPLPATIMQQLIVDRGEGVHPLFPAALYASRDAIYLCVNGSVVRLKNSSWDVLVDQGALLRQVQGVHPLSRCRFVITHEQGATLIRDNLGMTQVHPIAQSLTAPVAGFTVRSGHLVLQDASMLHVYETQQDAHRLIAQTSVDTRDPVAVAGWAEGDQFITLDASGRMTHCAVD